MCAESKDGLKKQILNRVKVKIEIFNEKNKEGVKTRNKLVIPRDIEYDIKNEEVIKDCVGLIR